MGNRYNFKHGKDRTKEHRCWVLIKQRCYNPKATDYDLYGGKGVTIAPEWKDDFVAFLDYVGEAPNPKYTLDRIDSKGNYEPGNVRWTTNQVQSINQKISSRNTSGTKGVGWSKAANKWYARISIDGKRKWLGTFDTKEKAIQVRKKAEEKYYKPLIEA